MRRGLALAGALFLVAGCAYYNGLYNANRLASEARKAEREGRTGEARSLWARAAVKAESVSVRFPESRWRDDALLLWGQALRRTDACGRAVRPLGLAADSAADTAIQVEARLALAECRLFMREPDSALVGLAGLVARGGPAGERARILSARAHLAAGRDADALAAVDPAVSRAADFPRATALARLGRAPEAEQVLAARADGPFEEAEWTPALRALAGNDPAAAARVATGLAARQDLTPGQRARVLLAASEGWLARREGDSAAVLLAGAVAIAPDSMEGRTARAHQLVRALTRLEDLAELPDLVDDLRAVTERGGPPVQVAGRFLTLGPRVVEAVTATSDAAVLFLAAEAVRDSLPAPVWASTLFLEVVARDSVSPLAPKAVVAALALRPERRVALLGMLERRWPDSPYTHALFGRPAPRYTAVEDSLAQVFAALRASPRRAPGAIRGGADVNE